MLAPKAYVNKQCKDQTMLTSVVADAIAHITAVVYDVTAFPMFTAKESLILQDFIKKADG